MRKCPSAMLPRQVLRWPCPRLGSETVCLLILATLFVRFTSPSPTPLSSTCRPSAVLMCAFTLYSTYGRTAALCTRTVDGTLRAACHAPMAVSQEPARARDVIGAAIKSSSPESCESGAAGERYGIAGVRADPAVLGAASAAVCAEVYLLAFSVQRPMNIDFGAGREKYLAKTQKHNGTVS